jgi:hypothetical protein
MPILYIYIYIYYIHSITYLFFSGLPKWHAYALFFCIGAHFHHRFRVFVYFSYRFFYIIFYILLPYIRFYLFTRSSFLKNETELFSFSILLSRTVFFFFLSFKRILYRMFWLLLAALFLCTSSYIVPIYITYYYIVRTFSKLYILLSLSL